MTQTERGTIIRNDTTGHACLISAGADHVISLLEDVRREGSYASVVRLRPDDRPLMRMLWMHRIIVTGRGDGRHLL